MNKLADVIEHMDLEELEMIKKDLERGNIEKLIKKRQLEKLQEGRTKICPVCHSDVGENNLTIIFGPEGLRKKASFCALDCLEYFIQKIKQEKSRSGEM